MNNINTNQNIKNDINQARKQAKGQWWTYVNYKEKVSVKGYKTWIQRIQFIQNERKITTSGPIDCSVKQFKDFLNTCLPNE